MENTILSVFLATIGWALILTTVVVVAAFAINIKFNTLENEIDRKLDALQDLILQNISPQPDKLIRE